MWHRFIDMRQYRRRFLACVGGILGLLQVFLGFLMGCAPANLFVRTATVDVPRNTPQPEWVHQQPLPFQFAAVHYTYADVFAQADIHSERLTQCVYGDVVRIDKEDRWWYRVKIGPYPELDGWMHKAALTKLSTRSLYLQERNITTIVIRRDLSRVFIWPSSAVDIVMGTELPFIGEAGQWYLVRLPSNDIGRIARESVYPSPAEQPLIQSKQEPTSLVSWEIREQRRHIVDMAHEFLGSVYVWGGSTPKGFDCSGLSYFVYKLNGIELPRVSWLQFREGTSRAIDKSQLDQGDLVFFTTYRKGPSHVGIYIGENRFIHASPTKGVTISDLDEPYFRSRYIGAKTVFSAS